MTTPAEAEGWDYVALQPINIDGVRAFNTGDPVPNDHVKNHKLDEVTAKVGTKKAKEAQGVTEEQSPPAPSSSSSGSSSSRS